MIKREARVDAIKCLTIVFSLEYRRYPGYIISGIILTRKYLRESKKKEKEKVEERNRN